MALKLDPRTKLYMIFVVSAVVMMSATTPFLWAVRITMTMIPILLLIIEKHYAAAFRFLILYAAALMLSFGFLTENSKGFLSAFLVGYCSIIVQFMPAMITAWYVVRTTKIGEFVCAMQKMHIPDGITISLAVKSHKILVRLKDLHDELETVRQQYDELRAERTAYKKEADRLARHIQQKRDSQKTIDRYLQNEQAVKRKKNQLE